MSQIKHIHIGHEIEARINQLNISKSEFARRIGTSKQNVNRILEKESIDTATLVRYGDVLDYNFFTLYSNLEQTPDKEKPASTSLKSGDSLICPDNHLLLIAKKSLEIRSIEKNLEERRSELNQLLDSIEN